MPVDVVLAGLVQLLQHVLHVGAGAGLEMGGGGAGAGRMQPQLTRRGVDVVEVEHVVGPVRVAEHVRLDVLGVLLPGADPVAADREGAAGRVQQPLGVVMRGCDVAQRAALPGSPCAWGQRAAVCRCPSRYSSQLSGASLGSTWYRFGRCGGISAMPAPPAGPTGRPAGSPPATV